MAVTQCVHGICSHMVREKPAKVKSACLPFMEEYSIICCNFPVCCNDREAALCFYVRLFPRYSLPTSPPTDRQLPPARLLGYLAYVYKSGTLT